MLVEIGKIQVKERIRKDYGNIEELANDIKENGLINPPVVTPEYELIAGERRLKALKYLNYKQIEVRVMSVKDYRHQLNLEISENENRKDFTFSERLEYARLLEEDERLKSKERQLASQNNNAAKAVTQHVGEQEKGETNEIVAQKSGFGSGENYRRAKHIGDNADEEMIKKLDAEKLSINGAYTKLKEKNKELEQKLKQQEEESKTKLEELQTKLDEANIDDLLAEKEEAQLNEKTAYIELGKLKLEKEKIENEKEEIIKQKLKIEQQIEELKNQEPEVVEIEKEVISDKIKSELYSLECELEEKKKELKKTENKLIKAEKQVEELKPFKEQYARDEYFIRFQGCVDVFLSNTLALTGRKEELEKLPNEVKNNFIQEIELLKQKMDDFKLIFN